MTAPTIATTTPNAPPTRTVSAEETGGDELAGAEEVDDGALLTLDGIGEELAEEEELRAAGDGVGVGVGVGVGPDL
jgi:hypothetical protein